MVACSLLDAPGETLSKAPVGGSCREEDTHFSNPYSSLLKSHILSSNGLSSKLCCTFIYKQGCIFCIQKKHSYMQLCIISEYKFQHLVMCNGWVENVHLHIGIKFVFSLPGLSNINR